MAPLTSPESKPISSTNVFNEACPNPSSMFHFLFINIAHLISKTKQKLKFLADLCDANTLFLCFAIRLFNAMPKYIRCISSCSVVGFKSKLDCYLKNIVDLPGRPGFSNSLDSGDILQWWTPREDQASN